ncbi:MAG: hypothetical protein HW416_13 [Chloroflexi bacterium]|nr:hypothetical protein [Chloroflexota bacterium]
MIHRPTALTPLIVAAGILVLAACAPSPASSPAAETVAPSSRFGGTLKIAWAVEPNTLAPKFIGGSGSPEYQWLFSSTLTFLTIGSALQPMLAEDIPMQSTGSWVINPDGSMVTTYRLRQNAKWHDGTPLTAQDFVFAFDVYVDKDLPVIRRSPENLMARVEALDDSTLVIRWKETYAGANSLGFEQLLPLPRHVLEGKYRSNDPTFVSGPEWTTAYISTGPFKVDRWTPGVGIVAAANGDFVLGPPKLDSIDIRFVLDSSAQLANLLSGEVDMINSTGAKFEDALVARDRWRESGEGYIKTFSSQAPYIEWQFREVPNWQRAIADVRVRQALLHAIDLETLNETLNRGLTPVAHAFVSPEDPLFSDVVRVVTKYSFDRARAATLLDEAGWRQPAGGGMVANLEGKLLDVEQATTPSQERASTIIADNWKAAGVNSSFFVVPQAQARDAESSTNFVATRASSRFLGPDQFAWSAMDFPTPENRWTGVNTGSFFDAEVDRLHNLRLTSLDDDQRRQATISLMKRMTEVVAPMPVLYSVEFIVARRYVLGPVGRVSGQNGLTWNVHEWALTP